jgi:perosamine synthetase
MNTQAPQITIPWAQPVMGEPEIAEVMSAFRADWLTQGPKTRAFEEKMAAILGVPHAVAVSNGSVAIDIALQIMGIRPGDEVIVPSMTYFATAAGVSRIGAIPVFVDVEPDTMGLNPDLIEGAMTERTKGVVFIDHGGGPSRASDIVAKAKDLGLICLQDAAQSLGGTFDGAPLGSQAVMSTMSFHLAKIMTTVEGGMIFTHDEGYAREARIYRSQGEEAKYHHTRLGTNARMTDIQAAIGLHQADRLPGFLAERARIVKRYDARLVGHPGIERPQPSTNARQHANFLYSILVEDRDGVASALRQRGIDTRVCYPVALYNQPVYATGRTPSRITPSPVSEDIARRILNLPLYPQMSDQTADFVADTLIDVLRNR